MLIQYGDKNLSVTSHMIVVTQSLCFNKNELRQGRFKVACQRCCLYQEMQYQKR